jgi:CheY-like chemotaxis protein
LTSGPKAQVLVIDDSPDVRTFLALWLTGFGCDVRTVADGHAAERELAEEMPDVILLDVVLPGMNGFDLCERLKQHASTRQIPVVMMSGLRQPANMRRAREVGAGS